MRKTAGSSEESWDRKGELNGFFVQKKEGIGKHKSNVYVIEKKDGSRIDVWGSAVLDTKFEEIPLESEVWIKPLGEQTSKSGSVYFDYEVEYDDELPAAEQAARIKAGSTDASDTLQQTDNPFKA